MKNQLLRLLTFALLALPALPQATQYPPTYTDNPYQLSVTNSWLYLNKIHYAGTWTSTTIYNNQDMVFYAAATYISLQTNNVNNVPSTATPWWVIVPGSGSGPGGGAAWGNIGGTLANQLDLTNALATKEPAITGGLSTQFWRGDKTWQLPPVVSFNSRTGAITSGSSDYTTSLVAEGSNLYYTDARAAAAMFAAVTATSPIAFNSLTGIISCPTCGGSPSWGGIGGTLANQSDLSTALSGKEPVFATGTTSQFLRGDMTWQLPPVTSFNSRTGAIAPGSSDYTTSQIAEGSNLYFTNLRAQTAAYASFNATSPLSYNNTNGGYSCPTCVITSQIAGMVTATTLNNNTLPASVTSLTVSGASVVGGGETVTGAFSATGNGTFGATGSNACLHPLDSTSVDHPICATIAGLTLGAYAGTTGTITTIKAGSLASSSPSQASETIWGGNLDVADPGTLAGESFTNGALTSGTSWVAATDCALTSNAATCTFSAGTPSSISQGSGVLAIGGVANTWYKLVYDVSGVTGTPTANVSSSFAISSTALPLTVGTGNVLYFKSASAPAAFTFTTTLIAGQSFTLDNLSLKRVAAGSVTASGGFLGNLTGTSTNVTGVVVPSNGGTGDTTVTANHAPPWMRFLGDGSEGPSTCSGNLTGEHWYTTFTVAGATTCTDNVSGIPLIIRATGACTIAGTINARGIDGGQGSTGDWGGTGGGGGGSGSAGGTSGATSTVNGTTVNPGGTGGGIGGGGGGGNVLPLNKQRTAEAMGVPFPKGGGPGGAGGSSGGAGGLGGQVVILACGSINFTGTIDVSGQAGGAGGLNTGSGGGGGGGWIMLAGLSITANSGTLTAAAGAAGAIGTGTSTPGGPGAAGWSAVLPIQ